MKAAGWASPRSARAAARATHCSSRSDVRGFRSTLLLTRTATALGCALVAALSFAGIAAACVCADAPLSERLDQADAAVVGRVVAVESGNLQGAPQRTLTVQVDQRVKGDVDRTLVVHSPSGSDCDLIVPEDEAIGLLLTRDEGGAWLGTACSVVEPGLLVTEGGEPRGGPIKVAIGIAVLVLVLLWALRRLRRGARPELPGAPEP